jgi:kynurenine aminotransferase
LDPETEIMTAAGANEGIYAFFAAFLEPGDEVIMMEPYFDQYLTNITMNGGVPVYVPLRQPKTPPTGNGVDSNAWYVDMDELESKITSKTKALIINTPHNPVGKVFDEYELKQIGDLAVKHNLLILADEVYDCLVYKPHQHVHIGAMPEYWDRTVTVGSIGKTFGITGWRVGWLIGPHHLVKHPLAAQTRIVFCTNAPLQEAAAVSLEQARDNGFFDLQVEQYTERKHKLSAVFDSLGLPFTEAAGSYFTLVDTTRVRIPTNYEFPPEIQARGHNFRMCYWLTCEIGVTAIPMSEFYSQEHQGMAEHYARFAFCKSMDVLEEAERRLEKLREYIV